MVAQQTILFDGGGSSPTSPHQFKIKELSAKKASMLNELWHSRLPKIHWSNIVRNKKYVCYGFFFKQECFAVAIWSSPICNNIDQVKVLELRRYAIKPTAPKNTASWGLKRMRLLIKKKFPDLEKFISYQDTAVHKGTIYKASAWLPASNTKFTSWTNKVRKRNVEQATGDKVRWECMLGRAST